MKSATGGLVLQYSARATDKERLVAAADAVRSYGERLQRLSSRRHIARGNPAGFEILELMMTYTKAMMQLTNALEHWDDISRRRVLGLLRELREELGDSFSAIVASGEKD